MSALGPYTEKNVIGEVKKLVVADTRSGALQPVLDMCDKIEHMGTILWHTPGVVAGFLQDIIVVQPIYEAGIISADVVHRVVVTLKLLQYIAKDEIVSQLLLASHVPVTLYPFISCAPTSDESVVTVVTACLTLFNSFAGADVSTFTEFAYQANFVAILHGLIGSQSGVVLQMACLLMVRVIEADTTNHILEMGDQDVAALMQVIDTAGERIETEGDATLPSDIRGLVDVLAAVAAKPDVAKKATPPSSMGKRAVKEKAGEERGRLEQTLRAIGQAQ